MTDRKLYHWTGHEIQVLIITAEYPNQYRVNQEDSKYVRHVNKSKIDKTDRWADKFYSFDLDKVRDEISRQVKEKHLAASRFKNNARKCLNDFGLNLIFEEVNPVLTVGKDQE